MGDHSHETCVDPLSPRVEMAAAEALQVGWVLYKVAPGRHEHLAADPHKIKACNSWMNAGSCGGKELLNNHNESITLE